MSFDDGFILGLSMASGSSDPDPEPEWQPPTDWITVEDPKPYELYFLVAKEGSFTFDCQLYRPDLGSTLENCEEATVYWGDGNVEVYKNFHMLEHSYPNGGMYLIKIVTDGKPCMFYSCNAPVLIAKIGDEIITNTTGYNSGPFYGCRSYIKQIKIGGKDGIQENEFNNFKYLVKFDSTIPLNVIPNGAFSYCRSFKNIDLSHVTSIGKYAFSGCWNLNCDIDGQYITSIEEEAFYFCYNIRKINAPNLTTIGIKAFNDCTNLKSINAPNLSVINYQAFAECDNLNFINMPNLISISESAFANCKSLKSVEFPMLTEINKRGFFNCGSLRTIITPKVTTIGDYAFDACKALEIINMPNVSTVGNYAFGSSAVNKVYMPKCISFGDYCFESCYNLDSPKDLDVADNCTFGSNCFSDVRIYPPIA